VNISGWSIGRSRLVLWASKVCVRFVGSLVGEGVATVGQVQYETGLIPDVSELVELYDSVGWSVYTDDPDHLDKALRNSTFIVVAREQGHLVGLARVLSDDVSIVYVQDVLVNPTYQRQGVGRQLLERCLERFAHVRQRMLLTDDEPHQHRLYKSVGFHDVAQLDNVALHAFVDIAGVELTSSTAAAGSS